MFFIDHILFSDNCYTFNTFAIIEPISDPKLLEPLIFLDSLESISIKFMTNTECRRFLPENTDQYHKEIMCSDTLHPQTRVSSLDDSYLKKSLWQQYKVSQL